MGSRYNVTRDDMRGIGIRVSEEESERDNGPGIAATTVSTPN